jgi:hypothetical protein
MFGILLAFMVVTNFGTIVDFFLPPISSTANGETEDGDTSSDASPETVGILTDSEATSSTASTDPSDAELKQEVLQINDRDVFVSYLNSGECRDRAVFYFKGNDIEIAPTVAGQPTRILERSSISDDCYTFVAPSLSGEASNFQSGNYISDITNLMEYFRTEFGTTEFYGLAFSAGGYPLTDHHSRFGMFRKVALLAPATFQEQFGQEEFLNFDGKTKIWHGDSDQNINLAFSREFVAEALRNNSDVQLEILSGRSHFDQLASNDELVQFFES